MTTLGVLILLLVVIGHSVAEPKQHYDLDSVDNSGSQLLEAERRELKNLLPSLDQLAQARALDSRDDDHYTIELDKLNGAHRYEISPISNGLYNMRVGDQTSLNGLFSRPNANWANERLVRSQQGEMRKRGLRHLAKEDKDYSFVGGPAIGSGSGASPAMRYLNRGTLGANNKRQITLRDLLLSNPTVTAAGPKRFNVLDDDHNIERVAENLIFYPDSSNELMPNNNREKRRRCKIDPNLGVKNPSFCDTDAYFGAADYSMRDVWDSAGR